jgi:uncharacterized membrane protein YgdD (TMEM256/DUF423 family)
MDLLPRLWLALAALNGLIGVAAGAFGAHGVSDPKVKEWLHTGAEYELIHALAVVACLVAWRLGARAAACAAWLFLAGAALFSGSLYIMALSGQRWLGAVTPIGGLLLLAGWATLAVAAMSAKGSQLDASRRS